MAAKNTILGTVPKSRGRYTEGDNTTKWYYDNILEYKGSSFRCISEASTGITGAPATYNSGTHTLVPKDGWEFFVDTTGALNAEERLTENENKLTELEMEINGKEYKKSVDVISGTKGILLAESAINVDINSEEDFTINISSSDAKVSSHFEVFYTFEGESRISSEDKPMLNIPLNVSAKGKKIKVVEFYIAENKVINSGNILFNIVCNKGIDAKINDLSSKVENEISNITDKLIYKGTEDITNEQIQTINSSYIDNKGTLTSSVYFSTKVWKVNNCIINYELGVGGTNIASFSSIPSVGSNGTLIDTAPTDGSQKSGTIEVVGERYIAVGVSDSSVVKIVKSDQYYDFKEMQRGIASNKTNIQTNTEDIEELKRSSGSSVLKITFTDEDVETGKCITVNNTVTPTSVSVINADGCVLSKKINLPFEDGTIIEFKAVIFGYYCAAFFDSNEGLIRAITTANSDFVDIGGDESLGRNMQTLKIAVPANAKYLQVMACTTTNYGDYTKASDLYISGNFDTDKEVVSLKEKVIGKILPTSSFSLANKKVLVIGDSISTGTSSAKIDANNTPSYGGYDKWVDDLINCGYFPLDTFNNSQHATGFVAKQGGDSWINHSDFLSRTQYFVSQGKLNLEEYDLVVVFGGINDFKLPCNIDTEFKPAVEAFYSYISENCKNARICAILPTRICLKNGSSEAYTDPTGYISDKNSNYNTIYEFNKAMIDVLNKYSIPYLDLTNLSGFHPKEQYFREKWSLYTTGENPEPDGVHPNYEFQLKYMMPQIREFISGLI